MSKFMIGKYRLWLIKYTSGIRLKRLRTYKKEHLSGYVGFEVFTAVTMKSVVFWGCGVVWVL
jgi:hypothetical protein